MTLIVPEVNNALRTKPWDAAEHGEVFIDI
jgi:hypothetical protein